MESQGKTRDSGATRARIISAAIDEFSLHGIAGARVDRIAKQASANKSRIYDYFGDKEKLFKLVLEKELLRFVEGNPAPGSLQDIPEYVSTVIDYHRENPQLSRLLAWEALYFDHEPVPAIELRTSLYQERIELLSALLPKHGPQSVHVHFILLTIAVGWFLFPQIARMHIGKDPYSEESLEAFKRDVCKVVERILTEDST